MLTLPAYVGIILKKDNHILLIKRRNTDWAAECWKKGLILKLVRPSSYAFLHRKHQCFVCVSSGGQPSPFAINIKSILISIPYSTGPASRSLGEGWFDVNALSQNVTKHAQQALNGLQNNIRYSEK